jgi:hypothetical protein
MQAPSGTSKGLNGLTFAQMASDPSSKVITTHVSRKWQQITLLPVNETVIEWTTSAVGRFGDITSSTNATLAVAVEGAIGNAYEWEIVCFYEWTSLEENLVPGVTQSHSDTYVISAIRNFFSAAWDSEPGKALYSRGVRYVQQYIAGAASGVLESIATASPLLLTM